MSEPIVRVRSLRKNYPKQRYNASFMARLMGRVWGWTGRLDDWGPLNEGLPVLKGLDLDVFENEVLAIVGESGAGKSTLLHVMGALDAPNDGSVSFRGEEITTMSGSRLASWRNRTVGYVFQFYHLFPDLNALENVLVPAMVAYSTPAYMSRRGELHQRAEHLLEKVGLADRRRHSPSQLSGGEQQRVAIARALLLKPELLLCDEPTGNLDRKTGETIMDLLFELKESQGQTYVMVTHDSRLAERADRVVEMVDGRLKDDLSPSEPAPEAPAEPPSEDAPPPE
jgi:lipoprotein-releasing system ATP-binding protein